MKNTDMNIDEIRNDCFTFIEEMVVQFASGGGRIYFGSADNRRFVRNEALGLVYNYLTQDSSIDYQLLKKILQTQIDEIALIYSKVGNDHSKSNFGTEQLVKLAIKEVVELAQEQLDNIKNVDINVSQIDLHSFSKQENKSGNNNDNNNMPPRNNNKLRSGVKW